MFWRGGQNFSTPILHFHFKTYWKWSKSSRNGKVFLLWGGKVNFEKLFCRLLQLLKYLQQCTVCITNISEKKQLWPILLKRVRYFAFSESLTLVMNTYFVLINNSYKSLSIIKTRDSFGIYSSWGFQTVPEN